MIYIENNGKISKLTTDTPFTLTHTPVRLFDLDYGYSPDALEELLNSGAYYQLLIDSLPVYGGDIVKAAIVWDEKAQGSNGGSFTSGAWRQRDLNAKLDSDNIITLASNAVTILESGKYLIKAMSPAHAVDRHQIRIVKNGVLLIMGTSEFASNAANSASNRSMAMAVATLAVNDILKVEHQCQTTFATYGFGVGDNSNFGVEVYSVMELIMFT